MPNRTSLELEHRDRMLSGPAARTGRPLRVVHVMSALVLAGMEYGVIKVANRIDRRRFHPAIVCLRYESPDARAALDASVRVRALEENPSRNWGLVPKLADAFAAFEADVVHTHNWQTYVYGVLAARAAGVPVIIHGEHGHDTVAPSRRRRLAKRALAPFVDRFVAVSGNITRELETEWALPTERIVTIPNGVDSEHFRPGLRADDVRRTLGFEPGDRVISIIGGLRPIKDHATLIRAFARVLPRVPRARLLIVGSDYRRGHQKELMDLSEGLGVREAIRFEGTRSDIREILALSDAYVNSSLFEGMSNTILEAMASGKPVVATSVGGNVELIQDSATGLLVPPADPEALAARLERVLTDDDLRERLGRQARTWIERRHPMSLMVRRYEELYAETWCRRRLAGNRPVRERLKCAGSRVAMRSGATTLVRWGGGRVLTILTYHRVLPLPAAAAYAYPGMVLPRDTFEHQVAHLARRYHVLPFEESLRGLADGTLPERAVVLTFDDGYRDNYDYALPILRRYGVPATFFLVAGAIEKRERLWWDEVAALEPDSAPALVSRLNGAPRKERLAWLARARDRRGSSAEDRDGLMMRWDEVREILDAGMTIGSHTYSHAFLDELDEAEAHDELVRSFDLIRERTGAPRGWLAFPRGRALPGSSAARRLADAGVTAAVTTDLGVNAPGCDLLALRRIDAGYARLHSTFDGPLFDFELTGLPSLLARR